MRVRTEVHCTRMVAAIALFVVAAMAPALAFGADRPQQPAVRQAGAVVRVIEDPNSGERWMLLRDATHPGGPGRLVRVGSAPSSEGRQAVQRPQAVVPVVIHAGDRVRLEEHSPLVDAVFDSVALGAAVAGDPVQVRLSIGGRVARAIATAPGRAVLAETGAQP